jgi:Asp-tRNA(Asn)/Glu-tRNA(Gln) amidotransferase B subunit
VTPDALAELIAMVDEQTLSARAAKQVLAQVWREGGRPREVAERSGLRQVSDPNALAEVVREVIAANPQQAAQLRAGKEGVRGWLVGQIMKASRGRANPHVVQQMLDQVLAEEP